MPESQRVEVVTNATPTARIGPFQMSARHEKMLHWGNPGNGVEAPPDFCGADRNTTSPSPPQFRYRVTVGLEKILQWEPPVGSEELALALSYHFPEYLTLEAKMKAAIRKKYCGIGAYNEKKKSPKTKQLPKADQCSIYERMESPPMLGSQPKLRHKTGNVGNIRSFASQEGVAKKSALLSEQISSQSVPRGAGVLGVDRSDKKPPTARRPEIPILTFRAATGEVLISTSKKRPYTEDEQEKIAINRGNACDEHRHQKKKCDPMKCLQNKQNRHHGISNNPMLTDITGASAKIKPVSHLLPDPERFGSKGTQLYLSGSPQPVDGHSNILDLISVPSANGGAHLGAVPQNIPEVQATTNSVLFNDLETISHTTKSSSSPVDIFTIATSSSSANSSAFFPQIPGPSGKFGAVDDNGSDLPLVIEEDDEWLSAFTTIGATTGMPDFLNRVVQNENTPLENKDLSNGAEMFQAGSYHPSFDDFLDWDPSLIPASTLKIPSNNSRTPSWKCHRNPSFDQFYLPTVDLTTSGEAYTIRKESDEYLMPPAQTPKQFPPIRNERYGTCNFAEAMGGNNRVVRDYHSPGKPCYTRTLSGRSVHSNIGGSVADGKEFGNSIMRQNSVTSVTSYDSRYSTLNRFSTHTREEGTQEKSRRDSSNSAISTELQHGMPERGYRQSSHSDKSRRSSFQDRPKRSSAYDANLSPSGRQSDSDDLQIVSGRDRKPHTLHYRYKGGILPVPRNTRTRSDSPGQEQSIEQLTSVLGFTHI